MEPFLAIGSMLRRKGQQVVCAFPEQFRQLAEETGLKFVSLGREFIELLETDTGRKAMGGASGLQKALALLRLAGKSRKINKTLVLRQHELIEAENPDRIVYHPKAVCPVIWGILHPGRTVQVSPVPYLHYVKDHAHIAFNRDFGPFLNRLTYWLADFGLTATTMAAAKWTTPLTPVRPRQIRDKLVNGKTIYAVSPTLFPKPLYWRRNLQVLGFQERNKTLNWTPDKELIRFLEKHKKILFITFGSMVNPEPVQKTKLILEILEKNQIPAIVNTAAGGLVKPDRFDKSHICFVSDIPYDWIFPKIYAVVHHGGSGTTHMALKYGCATMAIPHIIDQFIWDTVIAKTGAGPAGIRIDKISPKTLEPRILELINTPGFKQKAEDLAGKMADESFSEEIYQAIIQ